MVLGCRVHLPQFPGVKCPASCKRCTTMPALPISHRGGLVKLQTSYTCICYCCNMAAKKNPTRKPVDPPVDPKKKDTIKKRTPAEPKPKPAFPHDYRDPSKPVSPVPFPPNTIKPYEPNWQVPKGTPWRPGSPYNPKNNPPKSPTPKSPAPTPSKPKTPDAPKKSPSSTTTTNPPIISVGMKSSTRGMNSKGKIVPNKKKK